MTLGTGIFASTALIILVMAVRQITLRKKWKLAGKVAAGLVAGGVLIVVGIYTWNYVANLPPAPSVVTELSGVKLGMSPSDVTLALGKPDTAGEPEPENGGTRIDYRYEDKSLTVTFYGKDAYSAKVEMVCTGDAFTKLLGFDNFSDENSIVQRLGKPDYASISKNGLFKAISYEKWRAVFQFAKGRVFQKCILQFGHWVFKEELLSPDVQRAEDLKAAQEKLEQEKREAEAKVLLDRQVAIENARPRLKPNSPTPAGDPSDPCAPNLSRAERLRRLATFGQVRETGLETYEAGTHSVTLGFGYGVGLISCR